MSGYSARIWYVSAFGKEESIHATISNNREGVMEILECIKTRHSIRAFTSKRVPKGVMKRILQAASNCPSYTNTQPWEVVVVTGQKGEALKEMLLNLAREKAPAKSDIPKPKGWPAALEERAREHGARRASVPDTY